MTGFGIGQATEKDRLEYVRERLRLLYVGITRAKTGIGDHHQQR